jgi:hypothetical protein
MIEAAIKLGYEVKILQYDKSKLREIAEFDENLSLGIFMSLSDQEHTFNFTKKTDPYEIGRTVARAQQVIGMLAALYNEGGLELLKANDYYFGNLQSKSSQIKRDLKNLEESKDNKPKKSVASKKYWLHSAPALFQEKEWADQLTKVLATLLRESYRIIPGQTLYNNLVPNLMTYSEVIRGYCTRSIITVPARGRNPAVTVDKVPVKPRANNLLLKEEIAVIDRLSSKLWEPTPFEKLSQEEWAETLLANGLKSIKSDLVRIYNDRATFLSKLASLTTKRLQAIRHMTPDSKTRRKSDITAEILGDSLLARTDNVDSFAVELMGLDPTGDLFLKEWATGDIYEGLLADRSQPVIQRLKQAIIVDLTQSDLYNTLVSKKAESLETVRRYRDNLKTESDAYQAWVREMKEKHGDHFISKWKSNLRSFDLSAANANIMPRQDGKKIIYKVGLSVPHMSSKPSIKGAKAPKKKRDEATLFYGQKRKGVYDMKPYLPDDKRQAIMEDLRNVATPGENLSERFIKMNRILENRLLTVHPGYLEMKNKLSADALVEYHKGNLTIASLVSQLPAAVEELYLG